MYRKILLPLDLTDKHDAVFDAALHLADRDSGKLLLLHVVEAVSGFSEEELEDFYAPLRARAETMLTEWSMALASRGAPAGWEIRTGKRGPSVVRYAAEEQCDLIVATSRRPDAERPGWGLGTVSHQIALMAPCSVLLVR